MTWHSWVHFRSMLRFVRKRYLWLRKRGDARLSALQALAAGESTIAPVPLEAAQETRRRPSRKTRSAADFLTGGR
jgi:hypothetical protein